MADSERPVPDPSRVRLAGSVLAAVVAISSLYFFTGRGWNQATHFDLVRAIVEHGTIRIDAYHENTGDKSFHDGHYYSNKAPGTPFLAAPFVAVARAAIRILGGDPGGDAALLLQLRLAAFVCGTVPTVVAALALFLAGLRMGASIPSALLAGLTFALATPAWIYSTMFWAHPLTTGCLATSFALIVALAESGSARRDVLLAGAAGLSAGWAVASEYTAAGAAVLLAAFSLWQVREGGRARVLRVLAGVFAGALLPAILLGAYHAAAFGSPFRLSYVSVVGFEGHQTGFFGFHPPRIKVVLQLLFGSYRGLFIASPILAGAACALVAIAVRPAHRRTAIVAASVFTTFLLINASFYYWAAGWCVGPRYMAAGTPFLCAGLAPVLEGAGRAGRAGFAVLAGISLFLMLAVLSTDAMPSESSASPVWGGAVPAFFRGAFGPAASDFNLGATLGLRGPASLLPLIASWILLGVFWIRRDRRLASRA